MVRTGARFIVSLNDFLMIAIGYEYFVSVNRWLIVTKVPFIYHIYLILRLSDVLNHYIITHTRAR